MVFNLPSVETGSIIEYYYQLRYASKSGTSSGGMCSDPAWEIQGNYPVRKAHYSFAPCPGVLDSAAGVGGFGIMDEHGQKLYNLSWYMHLPAGKTLQPSIAKRFDLDLSDIPPLPNEAWMPPIESHRYEVRFYYTAGNTADVYWAQQARYFLGDVNRFADTSNAIKSAAAGIVSPSDSDLDKAQKLYAAVQALDNTDFSRAKGKAELKANGFRVAKRADDTWNQKSGSGQDIALLYLALLRGAGLNAYPMKVVDRRYNTFNPNYLDAGQLNAFVVILDTSGKEIFLDPAEKMCPFGLVSWRHSGTGGIRQTASGAGPGITPLLPYSANALTRRASLTVASDCSVTGKLNFTFTGQQALYWRQLALREDDSAVRGDFDRWLQTQVPAGTQAHVENFSNLDNITADLTASLHYWHSRLRHRQANSAPGGLLHQRRNTNLHLGSKPSAPRRHGVRRAGQGRSPLPPARWLHGRSRLPRPISRGPATPFTSSNPHPRIMASILVQH